MSYKSVREILNSVFDSDDHALKTIFKTDGEVLNMVLDESGDPALKVRMDGSAGSGLTDEEKTALAKASKNYLINPFDQAFCVNQRAYVSGTVVSGGTYMYDRWKASGGDASITFDGKYYSISGTIEQVIESPALSGQTVILSADTGGTTVECEVDGQTGTLPMTVTIAGTGHISVKLTGGKVKNVKLGYSNIYIQANPSIELVKARRYFERQDTGGINYKHFGFGEASGVSNAAVLLQYTYKRVSPTISFSDTAHFRLGNVTDLASITGDLISKDSARAYISVSSGLTTGSAVRLFAKTSSAYIDFDSEI